MTSRCHPIRNAVTLLLPLVVSLGLVPGGRAADADRPWRMAQAAGDTRDAIFRGVGYVTAVEANGALTINHEPIAGLMPAMEMMFSVRPRALSEGVRPGDKVEFSLEGKTYTIVALRVTGHAE